MTIHDDLAQWGEPPAGADEAALAAALDRALEKRAHGEDVRPEELLADSPELIEPCRALLEAARRVEQFVASVLEHSDLGELSTATAPPTESPASQPFPGEFQVRALVGEGAFGAVWLADDLGLGIPVALKTLRFSGPAETRPAALEALRNEARVLARLDHPNIVRVYGLRQVGGVGAGLPRPYYLVLRYVAGGSLQARLRREGPLDWRLAARYLADVGEALLHVHAAGIVHRDVKPANILWDPERDEALLTDFGLSARLAQGAAAGGTPLFMAPEAFDGEATPAGDVYGLAATLFALLTGEPPFHAPTRRELQQAIRRGLPDPDPRCAGFPELLERVVRAGLSAAPERRPDLPAFVDALRGALNRLLVDALLMGGATPAPVELRLVVSRWEGGDAYRPVAATHPEPAAKTRDLTKAPPAPDRVALRTGDRVRIEAAADRDGHVLVFNVGPTGRLSLLYPDVSPAAARLPVAPAHRPLRIDDVVLTPPAGSERLFAVWSREPLSLEGVLQLGRGDEGPVSRPYRATRNMERVRQSVGRLRRADWHAVVLQLDHGE